MRGGTPLRGKLLLPVALILSTLLVSQLGGPGGPRALLQAGANDAAVNQARSECAGDPACASSIKKLVAKAAGLCASDPSCICDWTRHAQDCFFKVAQQHPTLLSEAKELQSEVKEKAQVADRRAATSRRINAADEKLEHLLQDARAEVRDSGNIWQAKRDLFRAEREHDRVARLTHGGKTHRYELQREVQELKQAAHAIADAARARAVRRAAPSEALEGEVGTLASEMSQLTKAVGVISAAERTGGTPKEGIRQLAGAVASLTGRVADLHHSRAFRDSFASRAAAGETPLERQERLFARAVAGGERAAAAGRLREAEKEPPPPRTKWTRRVPHPVLIGHAASLTPY